MRCIAWLCGQVERSKSLPRAQDERVAARGRLQGRCDTFGVGDLNLFAGRR